MSGYLALKILHIGTVCITISLFVIRFMLSIKGNDYAHQGWMKRLPPVNDTLLLATAIALLLVTRWQIGQHLWITVKVIGVVIYIGFGWFALHRPLQPNYRVAAFSLAITTLTAIIFLALTKPL